MKPALVKDNHHGISFHNFTDRQLLAEALAEHVAEGLSDSIIAREQASLVVSGGSTPVPFFEALKTHSLDWPKLTVTLADERFVSPTHDDSNEKLVREHLLTSGAQFIPLMSGNMALEAAAKQAETALAAIPLPFTAVILGMGEDGHTASLFPHHPQLATALDPRPQRLCLPVTNSPKPPADRLTLTYAALINSHRIYIHITGKAKRVLIEKALAKPDPQEWPIAAFLTQTRAPIEIWWAE